MQMKNQAIMHMTNTLVTLADHRRSGSGQARPKRKTELGLVVVECDDSGLNRRANRPRSQQTEKRSRGMTRRTYALRKNIKRSSMVVGAVAILLVAVTVSLTVEVMYGISGGVGGKAQKSIA